MHFSPAIVFVLIVSLMAIALPFWLAIRTREPLFFWLGLMFFVWIGFTGARLLFSLGAFK